LADKWGGSFDSWSGSWSGAAPQPGDPDTWGTSWGGAGGAWGYSWIGSQVQAPTEPAGSGGFLYEYGLYLRRAAKKRRRQKELEEESRALKDKVDREIAELLRLQEAEDEKRDNLARLQRLVQKHSKDALELSDRAKIAYVRALTQANFSALEALDRELQRMIEEEEITALMILLNED
jgi:hypothetical protein